mmetsp:Transcript_24564/g.46382  ORF Transcript_24564/g.46382 Transcript_24564/m.46382 type:complete len:295 (-) Transcript_24564:451-1335(-)
MHLVLEILDLPVLRTKHLLQLPGDVGDDCRIQAGVCQHFRELSLLLIELLRERVELLLEHDILAQFGLPLDLLHGLLESLVKVITLFLHLPVLVLTSPIFLLGFRDLLLQFLEVGLEILQSHLVLYVVLEALFKLALLPQLLLQRLGQIPVLLLQKLHLLFVGLLFLLHLKNLILQRLDELKVVMRDVVVVCLDFIKSFLVIEQKLIDMLVLTLLNFMDLHLASELKVYFELLHLLFILDLQLLMVILEGVTKILQSFGKALEHHLHFIFVLQLCFSDVALELKLFLVHIQQLC